MRKKVRTALSLAIFVLSAAVLVLYYTQTPAMANPVSSGRVMPQPSQAPAETPKPTAVPEPPESEAQLEQPWSLLLVNGENPIDPDYNFIPAFYDSETVDSRIYNALTALLDDARNDGLSLWVASSYRDIETQTVLLKNATKNRMRDYGMTEEEARDDALKTIAKPGYSEHHTGLAVDFNNVSADFETTPEYEWLCENAAAYGFVQRYPHDKQKITGIDVEPWHYRYVGAEYAEEMNRLGFCLEEYMIYMNTR